MDNKKSSEAKKPKEENKLIIIKHGKKNKKYKIPQSIINECLSTME
ncbi:hypothetical protein [Clostridium sp. DL1XJH146]